MTQFLLELFISHVWSRYDLIELLHILDVFVDFITHCLLSPVVQYIIYINFGISNEIFRIIAPYLTLRHLILIGAFHVIQFLASIELNLHIPRDDCFDFIEFFTPLDYLKSVTNYEPLVPCSCFLVPNFWSLIPSYLFLILGAWFKFLISGPWFFF